MTWEDPTNWQGFRAVYGVDSPNLIRVADVFESSGFEYLSYADYRRKNKQIGILRISDGLHRFGGLWMQGEACPPRPLYRFGGDDSPPDFPPQSRRKRLERCSALDQAKCFRVRYWQKLKTRPRRFRGKRNPMKTQEIPDSSARSIAFAFAKEGPLDARITITMPAYQCWLLILLFRAHSHELGVELTQALGDAEHTLWRSIRDVLTDEEHKTLYEVVHQFFREQTEE